MENRNIIIILLVIVVIAAVGLIMVNFHTTEEIEYESLNLSATCTVSVPVCNNTTLTEDDYIKTYNATNLTIISYNKNDLGEWENLGADIGVYGALNQNFKYNHSHHGNSILIHPDDNVTIYACLISNNTTGDVLIIETSNEEVLYHIIDNVNFTIDNLNSTSSNENISQDTSDDSVEAVEDSSDTVSETTNKQTSEEKYVEGYIAENDHDFDYDGDGVGDGSAYHSHEYYVEHGQKEPIPVGGE